MSARSEARAPGERGRKIDPSRYARLLSKALPVSIRTETDYKRMLKVVDSLLQKGEASMTREELALLDLVSTLIEKYEDELYPIPEAKGHQVLRYLIEDRGLKQRDLLTVFRSSGLASEVINGKRRISRTQAKKLGQFFRMSPDLFIDFE